MDADPAYVSRCHPLVACVVFELTPAVPVARVQIVKSLTGQQFAVDLAQTQSSSCKTRMWLDWYTRKIPAKDANNGVAVSWLSGLLPD